MARETGALVVNDDDIVTAVHCGYHWEEKTRHLYRSIQELIVAEAIAQGRDVIVDTGGRSAKRRSHFRNMWGGPGHLYLFPWEAPEIHAKRRVEHDPRGYTYERWLSVAQRHESEYEAPDDAELLLYEQVLRGPFGHLAAGRAEAERPTAAISARVPLDSHSVVQLGSQVDGVAPGTLATASCTPLRPGGAPVANPWRGILGSWGNQVPQPPTEKDGGSDSVRHATE